MSVEKVCAACGAKNGEQAKFCASCGSRVVARPILCMGCGTINDPGARFCIECGTGFWAVDPSGPPPQFPSARILIPEPPGEPTAPPSTPTWRTPPLQAAPNGPSKTKSPPSKPSTRDLSDNKLAAIAIWILCLIAVFIALVKGQVSHDQIAACMAAGGSAKDCSAGPLWGKIVWVVATASSGAGAHLWFRK